MVQYRLGVYLPIDYKIGEGWIYDKPVEEAVFTEPVKANQDYDTKLSELSRYAVMHSKAVTVMLSRYDDESPASKPELQRFYTYEGENVFGWYCAYHKPGKHPVEERYYISKIYVNTGYYTFMHQKEKHPEIYPVACAQDLDELQQILGDKFHLYEIRA